MSQQRAYIAPCGSVGVALILVGRTGAHCIVRTGRDQDAIEAAIQTRVDEYVDSLPKPWRVGDP